MTRIARPPLGDRLLHALLLPAHLIERARGRRRLLLLFAYALVLVPVMGLAWRELQLVGLPDVGDPFDTAKFAAREVPDDQNAFVFYRRAGELLKPLRPTSGGIMSPGAGPALKGAPPPGAPTRPRYQPNMMEWVQDNREALDVWLQGTRCPDALDIRPSELRIDSRMDTLQQLRDFAKMAQLEGNRLEDEGDMAGAYRMYQAILRSSRHASLNGTLIGRLVGVATHGIAAGAVEQWADDKRTGPDLLRVALQDAREFQRTRVPNSFAFKHEYFWAMNLFNDPNETAKIDHDEQVREQEFSNFLPLGLRTKRWLRHEPERSRRVYRLWAANWFAYCDLSRDERPGHLGSRSVLVFKPGTNPPPNAHRLSPEDLRREIEAAPLARLILPSVGSVLGAMDREDLRNAGLIVALAEELYRRDHGGPPRTLGDLLGPYLDELPAEYGPMDPPLTAVPPPAEVPSAP
jgi:hypothetical protein